MSLQCSPSAQRVDQVGWTLPFVQVRGWDISHHRIFRKDSVCKEGTWVDWLWITFQKIGRKSIGWFFEGVEQTTNDFARNLIFLILQLWLRPGPQIQDFNHDAPWTLPTSPCDDIPAAIALYAVLPRSDWSTPPNDSNACCFNLKIDFGHGCWKSTWMSPALNLDGVLSTHACYVLGSQSRRWKKVNDEYVAQDG